MTIHRQGVVLLALCGVLITQAAAAPAQKRSAAPRKPAAVAVQPAAPAPQAAAKAAGDSDTKLLLAEIERGGADKKHFKAYLKRRLGKIKEQQKARVEFLEKEADLWKRFSAKLYDDRELFETRIIRQMTDMFESLSSLDLADRAASFFDVGIVQGNMVKTFESQQKQRLTEFFFARDQRWKEFAANQEQERGEFVSQAASDWKSVAPKAEASAAPPEKEN